MAKARAKRDTAEFNKELGKRLRDLRLAHGLSMQKLSEIAGVSPSYIGKVEAGAISPTVLRMNYLARALNTQIEYFIR